MLFQFTWVTRPPIRTMRVFCVFLDFNSRGLTAPDRWQLQSLRGFQNFNSRGHTDPDLIPVAPAKDAVAFQFTGSHGPRFRARKASLAWQISIHGVSRTPICYYLLHFSKQTFQFTGSHGPQLILRIAHACSRCISIHRVTRTQI